MSYYAEYTALEKIIEKDREEGLTETEAALKHELLERLGIRED